ncbi:hypothetical protein RhiirA4_483909 [Rhizophagus irregularis]|uniref:Uncharacterized protein n=1 Tax=Rhizophagus irregularis TaxID=588596 RepID=A0A2I1HN92_9GLOM|nr:hypothetical protein RhiirA4_483909 [Rhizophagus irregularis]
MLANTDIKHADVVLFFNTKYKLDIDRSTITKIWQNREKWLTALSNSNIFRCRSVQFPELDKALQIWTSQAVTILQQKGLELAQMLNISEDQLIGGYIGLKNVMVFKRLGFWEKLVVLHLQLFQKND